jgi:hypothetical protein
MITRSLRTGISALPSSLVLSIPVGLLLGVFSLAALSSDKAPLLLAAGIVPLIAILVGGAQRLLLAIILLDIPLGLDIHLGFREDAAQMGALAGINVSASSLCIAVLYCLWLAQTASKQGNAAPARLRGALPLVLYIAALALSSILASNHFLALSQIWLYIEMLLLYLYVANKTESRQQAMFLVTVLLAGLTCESLLIHFVEFTGAEIDLGPISTHVDATYANSRVGGTLGAPNNAAAYLAMVMLVSCGILLIRGVALQHALAVLAFSTGGIALAFTGSRGGWVSFGVAFLIFSFVAWRRGWISPRRFAVIAILLALLGVLAASSLSARLLEDDHGAAYSRIPLNNLAFRIIGENPILGVGANNFAAAAGDYITPDFATEWLYTVHNKFLVVWSETGTLGLAAFLLFLFSILRTGWDCTRSRDPVIAPLALALLAGVIAHIIHMTVDIFNDRQLVQLLIVFAALINALYSISHRAKRLQRETIAAFLAKAPVTRTEAWS